jgi:RNA-binding protein
MLTISPDERRALRAQAHPLKPVVMIAQNGLTDAVLKEIELALTSHELIKVRVFDAEREQRDEWLNAACEALGAAPVQRIGNILVLYRPNPELHVRTPLIKPVRKAATSVGRAGFAKTGAHAQHADQACRRPTRNRPQREAQRLQVSRAISFGRSRAPHQM